MIDKKKIKLYADGLNLDEFESDFGIEIDGYTFNPSLFKKNGATDYLDYSKKVVEKCKSKPVSLEVFADEEKEMIKQAEILNTLGNNVYVKIPITFTNKNFTTNVISNLIEKKIKLNITALFTMQQIIEILPVVKNSKTILSVFAGRIYDCGQDAAKLMREISVKVKKESLCQVLWASPRMSYDYINAILCGSDIITMQASQIKKLKLFEKKPEDYSLETIKQFYKDASSSGYKL